MEETGRNSVMPSTTPRITAVRESVMRIGVQKGGLFFLTQNGGEDGLGFEAALVDFDLAQNGLKTDIDLVPVVFQAAQIALVAVAQVAQGGGGADQGMDLLAGGGGAFHGGADDFQFLDDDGFDFEELVFLLRAEFFAAGDVDKIIELLQALQIVLQLNDELINFLIVHKSLRAVRSA